MGKVLLKINNMIVTGPIDSYFLQPLTQSFVQRQISWALATSIRQGTVPYLALSCINKPLASDVTLLVQGFIECIISATH